MKRENWDKFAGIYDVFMKKDHKAYEKMYKLIGERVKGRIVLELATGTGLIAKHIVRYAKHIEATDYSSKMIEEARKGNCSSKLHFSVQDACKLPYVDGAYDVVIISNALHIMSTPEKALQEIKRVLKPDGLLIAPTFTHGKMNFLKKLLSKMMGLVGFSTENRWTAEEYCEFLEKQGWRIQKIAVLKASFPLTYVECKAKNVSKMNIEKMRCVDEEE
ncbi:MAG: class I SAM-dependent methyltransferase [Lachnospiraceae bacterium]|nr:class I SAM-dependent methyltransferase [Lachnospiraceae bacterium]